MHSKPSSVPKLSWKRALGISCLPIYGPFILMATYTLLFVSCSHCKKTAWFLLAWAPGLLPVEAGRHLFDLPRFPDSLSFALAFVTSLAFVAAVAVLLRRSRKSGLWGIALALALASFFAVCTLAMIRS